MFLIISGFIFKIYKKKYWSYSVIHISKSDCRHFVCYYNTNNFFTLKIINFYIDIIILTYF